MKSTQFYEDYGLFCNKLGQLPDSVAHQALQSGALPVKTVDVAELMTIWQNTPNTKLIIDVPTIGFVDLLYSLDTLAQFALPLSINGVVSDNHPYQPQIYAKDLLGNHLDLSEINKASAAAVLSTQASAGYTTLSSLQFIFARDFFKQDVNYADLVGKLELLLPLGLHEPYHLKVLVMNDDGELVKKQDHYLQSQLDVKCNDFILHHDQHAFEILLNAPAQAVERVHVNMSTDKGYYEQYFGLSYDALATVANSLVTENAAANFLPPQNGWNDFSNPLAVTALKNALVDGLANKSLPLIALSPMLHFDGDLDSIQKTFDQHDANVWQQRMGDLGAEHMLEQLESLFEPHYDFGGALPTALDVNAPLDIQISLDGAGFTSESTLMFNHDYGLYPEHFMHLDSQAIAHVEGKTFAVGADKALNHADVIEHFSFERHDKIDLTQLLRSLNENSDALAAIEARETEVGDTQIWVTHLPSTHGEVEQLHVATLKGVSVSDGTLPDDLSSYISGGDFDVL